MGIVYKAFDQKLGRTVALKRLHVGVDPGIDAMVRFRGEAETLGSLSHPNIVQVFDFGMHEGAPYLVMEFVTAGSLAEKLRGKPQYPRQAAEMVALLARAIHIAHEKGVIHRDLKPGNVLLTRDGTPKITDFGLAKRLQLDSGLTMSNAAIGSPSYMAPEQAAGRKDVGVAADIYSLGAILYEMMTGRPPFVGATLQETLEQVQMLDPSPPSQLVPRLPRDLQSICLMCLHKSPSRRYRTALDLADDLKSWLDGLPVQARPMNSFEKLIRSVARRPQRAALAGAGLLVIILAVFLGVNELRAQHDRELREKEAQADLAKAAADSAQESLKNLKEMLDLILAPNLRTSAGLTKLEEKLSAEVKKLNDSGPSADKKDKKMVLVRAYSRLADIWRGQGDIDPALTSLNAAETLVKDEALTLKNDAAQTLPKDEADKTALSFKDTLDCARIYQLRGQYRADMGRGLDPAILDCETALSILDGLKGKPASNQDRKEYTRLSPRRCGL